MKKWTKIIIIVILVLSVSGVWQLKRYSERNTSSYTTEKENKIDIEQKNMPMLLELSSETCPPCRQMVPILEEVKKLYEGKASVKIVDVYENPKLADKYGISVIPTQIFLDKDGKEVYRHEGLFSKEEIVKTFDKMGVK